MRAIRRWQVPLKLVLVVGKADIECHDVERLGFAEDATLKLVAKRVVQVEHIRFEQVDATILAILPNQFISEGNTVLVFEIHV